MVRFDHNSDVTKGTIVGNCGGKGWNTGLSIKGIYCYGGGGGDCAGGPKTFVKGDCGRGGDESGLGLEGGGDCDWSGVGGARERNVMGSDF